MFNPEMMQDAINSAAEVGPDQTQVVKGGGDYVPPAAGPVRLRLISYIELGIHFKKGNPARNIKDKDNDLVTLQFELSGPKHPPREDDKGNKFPQIITISELNLSMNEKAGFYKLFKRMNHTGEYKHMSQLLGKPFVGHIHHNTTGEGADKKTWANLKDDNGFTIAPPFRSDFDSGESIPVEVDPPLSPIRCFIWQAATPEHQKMFWDTIHIDGKWDDQVDEKTGVVTKEGKSKNYFQNLIRTAKNFQGSQIAELIFSGDVADEAPDMGEAEKPARSEADKQASTERKAGASADPLDD